MLTLGQAKRLKPGDYVYQTDVVNGKGERRRWKVSGKVRTWKRDPRRVYVPLKHGLRDCDSLNEFMFPQGLCRFPVSLEPDPDSQRAAFECAVDANPADALPRLIFADWLDEQGDHELAEELRSL